MLNIHEISFSYGKKQVLQNFSMQVKAGEIVAVMGASGCGKSTLLQLIAGLQKPNVGKIEHDFGRISYAFQEPRLFPWLTVEENLKAVAEIARQIRLRNLSGIILVDFIDMEQAEDKEALLDFLQKRQGLLDGVCITGGEPTLQQDLPRLLQRIKALGYAVKLDTNGSQPGMLKELVAEGLVDYVAMDVKNSPARYGETVGVPQLDVSPMEESLRFLTAGGADYELRTTVVQELHDDQSIQAMGEWIFTLAQNRPVKALYIQPYKDADMVLQKGLHAPSEAVLQGFCALLRPFAQTVAVRG